ncbi:hypothetical protein KCU92_g2033, partial [Aureobasidium melanogenum]
MVDTSQERIYDEIEIEDMTYDPVTQLYTYPCPCGDRFEINIEDLRDGEEIAGTELISLGKCSATADERTQHCIAPPMAIICMCLFSSERFEFSAADQPGSRTREPR